MALTNAEVLHIAQLADLDLTPEEVERLRGELAAILDHVAQLDEVDTSSVAPTAHLAVSQMPLRDDQVQPGLGQERATAAGPRVNSGHFAVPQFVEE